MSGQPLDSVDAGQPGSSDHAVLTPSASSCWGTCQKRFGFDTGSFPRAHEPRSLPVFRRPKAALGNRGA